jgi:LacI family transcriptional regulator
MNYTIKDVARLAGVSPSTVSRVINSSAYVDPDKKNKVLKAIKELNYKPNFSGKSLKKGNTNIIAVILPDLYNPYYTKLSQSLEEKLYDEDLLMLLAISHNDTKIERKYLRQFTYGIADGVIIIPAEHKINKRDINDKFPTVVVNRQTDFFNYVTLDHEKAAFDSVNYLIENGHKKIVCYIGDIKNPIYEMRLQGCIKAFNHHGIPFDENNLIKNVIDVKTAYDVTNSLLDSGTLPTAIFATMDVLVSGVYSSIAEHNLSIPEDISVMGFDNNYLTENFIPPLTTYNHPTDLIARHAIELLRNQMNDDFNKKSYILSGDIVERNSVLKL